MTRLQRFVQRQQPHFQLCLHCQIPPSPLIQLLAVSPPPSLAQLRLASGRGGTTHQAAAQEGGGGLLGFLGLQLQPLQPGGSRC